MPHQVDDRRDSADRRSRILLTSVATVKSLCLAISSPRPHVSERRSVTGSLRTCCRSSRSLELSSEQLFPQGRQAQEARAEKQEGRRFRSGCCGRNDRNVVEVIKALYTLTTE